MEMCRLERVARDILLTLDAVDSLQNDRLADVSRFESLFGDVSASGVLERFRRREPIAFHTAALVHRFGWPVDDALEAALEAAEVQIPVRRLLATA